MMDLNKLYPFGVPEGIRDKSYQDFYAKVCDLCDGFGRTYTGLQNPDPCDNCGGYGFEPDYTRPRRKEKKMNYTTAAMLINDKIRAVSVSYEKGKDGEGLQRYTFKTLDHTIKNGDFVVIPTTTRHEMTVVRVEATDVDVDFEDETQLKWIVCKVDRECYEQTLIEEGKWIETFKGAEKRRKREELRKSMVDFAKDELEKLPFSTMGETLTIENK